MFRVESPRPRREHRPNCTKHPRPQLLTLARQISNRSFKNKPKTSPIFFDDLLSSILFINYLLPINEPATFYTETTRLSILQKLANCNKSGNKTHLKSPVSRKGLERWKRSCEQNRIGEMEKEKNTRASKESCNIATYL